MSSDPEDSEIRALKEALEGEPSEPMDGQSESLRQLTGRTRRMRECAEALLDPGTNTYEKAKVLNDMANGDVEARKISMQRLDVSEEGLLSFLTDCLTHHNEDLRTAAARVLTQLTTTAL